METNERENMNIMSRRENSGKVIDRLDIKFGGNKYDTQFTRTGKRKNILCMTCTN